MIYLRYTKIILIKLFNFLIPLHSQKDRGKPKMGKTTIEISFDNQLKALQYPFVASS